ncbi:hypothetical protein Tco_1239998, partial [Tanacetum coccineum]
MNLQEPDPDPYNQSSYARAIIELWPMWSLKILFWWLCLKLLNIVSDVKKNLNNPRHKARSVQVGTKVAFKPIKQVYRRVSNRNNASSSGKKKQVAVACKEIWYRVNGDDFYENYEELRFIVINNPFWKIMSPRMMTRSAGRPIAELRGRGTGIRVGRGGRGRRPRKGNDEHVDDLNGKANDQGERWECDSEWQPG